VGGPGFCRNGGNLGRRDSNSGKLTGW